MVDHNKIDGFWKAMAPLLKQVLADSENDELIGKIDQAVIDFGDYDWEYGPSKKTQFYFCLSPNKQESLIEEVDEIISFAPSLAGWEFISCKPRKSEILSFNMLNEKSEKITVDTLNWKCVVYKFPDNTVDLDIKLEEVKGDIDTQYTAVDIHLTNLLGERNYLKIVKQVNIVSEFSDKDSARSIPVNDLFKVISTHIPTVV